MHRIYAEIWEADTKNPQSLHNRGFLVRLETIKKKIERVMMRCEDRRSSGLFEILLHALSLIYGGVIRLRILFYGYGLFTSRKLPCIVISVGNITVGGVGKTPVSVYVLDLLRGLGYNVAAISRGYKGKIHKHGGVVSDGRKLYMDPTAAGDEPYLITDRLRDVPVLIGRNRFKMGQTAIRRFSTQVLVMDDCFQHLQLDRDIDLLLLDSETPFGNRHCIPRGPLREPVAGVKRASAIVLTRQRDEVPPARADLEKEIGSVPIPVFHCRHMPAGLVIAGSESSLQLDFLKGRRLFAFSGISRNDSFRRTVTDLGGSVDAFAEFFDHHPYSTEDLGFIWEKASALEVDNLITTEKDYVRIRNQFPESPQLLVLQISISFGKDKDPFERYLKDRVSRLTG